MKMILRMATLAAIMASGTALAETVTTTTTTKTIIQQKTLPNEVMRINFDEFDINGDGILSMEEVGEKLFYLYDLDGNQVIDNIEFQNPRIMTVVPMEKHTLRMVDLNSNGHAEISKYTYQTFSAASGLARFDADLDGLSAAEFIGESFLALDKNGSGVIELAEWKAAYIESRAPLAADQDRYN